VDYSQSVGSSLKRERVSVLAPLSHAQSFDNPQASSTQIRSGFVTQPGSLMGGARRKVAKPKKGFTEKISALHKRSLNRASGENESARIRNAALVAHLGLKEVPRALFPAKDTAGIHANAISKLAQQRYKQAMDQPWGPHDTKATRMAAAKERGADPAKEEYTGFGKRKKKGRKKK
jgi:hypothetical protein